jgi:hypothetical protein
MVKISEAELQIMLWLLEKEHGLASFYTQVKSAKFRTRNLTGAGYSAEFKLSKEAPRIDHVNAEPSDAFKTIFPPPRDLVGFTLLIRNGYISPFEGYMFGSVNWPDEPLEIWVELEAPAPAGAAPR